MGIHIARGDVELTEPTVNLCLACQEIFQTEEKLRDVLKIELSGPEPPGGLGSRVQKALREAPPKPSAALPWRGWKFAAAAVVFIAVAAVVLLFPVKEQPQALAAEAGRGG